MRRTYTVTINQGTDEDFSGAIAKAIVTMPSGDRRSPEVEAISPPPASPCPESVINPIAECFNCSKKIVDCTCDSRETYEYLFGPTCPYCGEANSASDSDGLLYNEDTTEYSCGSCGEEFDINISISFSWTSKPKKQ